MNPLAVGFGLITGMFLMLGLMWFYASLGFGPIGGILLASGTGLIIPIIGITLTELGIIPNIDRLF